MTDRTLRPSRRKAMGVVLSGVALAAFGFGATLLGIRPAWFLVGAGLFVAAVFVVGLATDRFYLRLSDVGLTVGALMRKVEYRWEDLAEFAVMETPMGVKSVVFTLTAGGRARHPLVSRVERAVSRYDAGLPDTYGMSAEGLCELLATEHRRRLGAPAVGTSRDSVPGSHESGRNVSGQLQR